MAWIASYPLSVDHQDGCAVFGIPRLLSPTKGQLESALLLFIFHQCFLSGILCLLVPAWNIRYFSTEAFVICHSFASASEEIPLRDETMMPIWGVICREPQSMWECLLLDVWERNEIFKVSGKKLPYASWSLGPSPCATRCELAVPEAQILKQRPGSWTYGASRLGYTHCCFGNQWPWPIESVNCPVQVMKPHLNIREELHANTWKQTICWKDIWMFMLFKLQIDTESDADDSAL